MRMCTRVSWDALNASSSRVRYGSRGLVPLHNVRMVYLKYACRLRNNTSATVHWRSRARVYVLVVVSAYVSVTECSLQQQTFSFSAVMRPLTFLIVS